MILKKLNVLLTAATLVARNADDAMAALTLGVWRNLSVARIWGEAVCFVSGLQPKPLYTYLKNVFVVKLLYKEMLLILYLLNSC
jgi:hypothetical protein